jgi:diphthine-ammonia ligase
MNIEKSERCALSFSGGKDSILALDRAMRAGYHVEYLLTLYDAEAQRVRFHNVPIDLIQAQADALGIPLVHYGYTPATFEVVFLEALIDLRRRGITTMIFGDIHLADVRAWYEERTAAVGLMHLEPLWGDDPSEVVRECIARHYQATITCIELERAKPEWLGATLTEELVREFELAGIDVCGERGEYHTFVIAGPLFAQEVPVKLGEEVTEGRFRVVDIALGEDIL